MHSHHGDDCAFYKTHDKKETRLYVRTPVATMNTLFTFLERFTRSLPVNERSDEDVATSSVSPLSVEPTPVLVCAFSCNKWIKRNEREKYSNTGVCFYPNHTVSSDRNEWTSTAPDNIKL